jgi:hypothetical protein
MKLHIILSKHTGEILDNACLQLSRARLKNYSCSEDSENRKRLEKLLELTIDALINKELLSITSYMEETAKERFYAGFDFSEVHSAINVLEETLWKKIDSSVKSEEIGHSLGLISTILGAAKESLARTYISLASETKISSLDLNALFARK